MVLDKRQGTRAVSTVRFDDDADFIGAELCLKAALQYKEWLGALSKVLSFPFSIIVEAVVGDSSAQGYGTAHTGRSGASSDRGGGGGSPGGGGEAGNGTGKDRGAGSGGATEI